MTIDLLLEIVTHDKNLGSEIFNTHGSFSANTKIEIPGGAIITAKGIILKKAFGFPETLELLLSFSTGVVSGLVSSWIYEKLKGKAISIHIDRTEIQLNKNEIEKIIIEKIEKSTK